MKAIILFVFVFCYVECRKTYVPIDKNANLAFINMEGGGGVRPPSQQPQPTPTPAPPAKAPVPVPATTKPVVQPTPKPVLPPAPTPIVQPTPPLPAKPAVTPSAKPAQVPYQIKPVTITIKPTPVLNPTPTPGPGSVKQLINFYDSQGKASPIRPYSYSQAVKQG